VDGRGTLRSSVLNDFLALGRPVWTQVHRQVTTLDDRFAVPAAEVESWLPFTLADHVGLYSSM
jgi:hypothetical protein